MATLSSVQFKFSHSVMSDSLRPHESQHSRPPCPSISSRVHSDSCPSSQWCHPAISSSVVPFSSCPQSLPASESFPVSQLFSGGGQSTGVSALASFLHISWPQYLPSPGSFFISSYDFILYFGSFLKSCLTYPNFSLWCHFMTFIFLKQGNTEYQHLFNKFSQLSNYPHNILKTTLYFSKYAYNRCCQYSLKSNK